MKRISKILTAVLAGAMIFGSVLTVSANTLDGVSPAPGTPTDKISITQSGGGSPFYMITGVPAVGKSDPSNPNTMIWQNISPSNGTALLAAYIPGEKDSRGFTPMNFDSIVEGYWWPFISSNPAPASASTGDVNCTHDHAYWATYPASENCEETRVLACPDCGAFLGSTTIYGTAFKSFNNATTEAINTAPAGSTVTASTKRWNTINADVLNAITARDDVTVRFEYIRPNEGWTAITIPAGTDCSDLANEEGYAGFEYLITKFGCEPIL